MFIWAGELLADSRFSGALKHHPPKARSGETEQAARLARLRQTLFDNFLFEELKALAADLGIRWEYVSGETRVSNSHVARPICPLQGSPGCPGASCDGIEAQCRLAVTSPFQEHHPVSETIKTCLDKLVPPELEDLAKQLAATENPANRPRQTTPFEMAADWRYLWRPGSTLTVRFLGGDPAIRAKVEHYAHQWEQFANIKFQFVTSGKAQIRVAFIEGNGSWSYLGTQALLYIDQQIPTMNYGWLRPNTDDDEYTRVVLHEFGHSLGCIHEHQHPQNGIPWDKKKAYAYYGQQGWTNEEVDFQVFQLLFEEHHQLLRVRPPIHHDVPRPRGDHDGQLLRGLESEPL